MSASVKEEVLEAARKNGIGSLDEIEWGILETSGEMTFIKKSELVPAYLTEADVARC